MAVQIAAALSEAQLKALQTEDKLDDPLDYLNINFSNYCNKVFSISITEPTKYYEAKNVLSVALNTAILKFIHTTLFNLMRYGQVGNKLHTFNLQPSIPVEMVNKRCMDISVVIKNELDKIIQLLMPADNNNHANSSLRSKQLGSLIDTTP